MDDKPLSRYQLLKDILPANNRLNMSQNGLFAPLSNAQTLSNYLYFLFKVGKDILSAEG